MKGHATRGVSSRATAWIAGTIVGVAFLATLTPGRVEAQRRKSQRQEVRTLTVNGVHAVEKRDLLASLVVTASGCRSFLLKPFCLVSHAPAFYEHEYLNHDDLARDVIRARVFYYERGYRETVIDTVVTPAGKHQVDVTLNITEGQPTVVQSIAVSEQDALQRPAILRRKDIGAAIRVKQNEPLDLLRVDSTRALLQQKLWDHGYADARVDTTIQINTTAHEADLKFLMDPGTKTYVGKIEVRGLKTIEESAILKSLSFGPGDVFRRSDVLASQRSLYESNLFRRATIQVQDTVDSVKTVQIVVQEAPPRIVRYSVGFNTIDFVQAELRYTNYNWFGKTRRFTAALTVGNLFASQLNGNGIFYDVTSLTSEAGDSKYFLPTFTASIESRRPWFLSPHNEIAVGAFGHRRISPGIYVDRGYGASATFTRTLAERTPLSVNYRYELTGIDASDVYFCMNFGVCDGATLGSLHGYQRLSPLAVSVSRDRTDDPFEPHRGTRGQIDAELANWYTASNYRYGRLAAEGAGFLPLNQRSTLGVHLKLGYVKSFSGTAAALGVADSVGDALLHPRKRFYAGGSQSVRGFGESQLGPRVLTISEAALRADTIGCPASLAIADCHPNGGLLKDQDFEPRPLGGNILAEMSVEYRYRITTDFIAAVFVDGGYLAQRTAKELPESQSALTPGFGVRYKSPVGPIRVDVGINPVTTQQLPVVTEDPTTHQLIQLKESRAYSPSHGGFSSIASRLTLHLSIGEAF